MAAGFFGFSTRPAAWVAIFRPSSTGVRLLAGFCTRGRSGFERAMTRPRSPAAEIVVFRARAGGLPGRTISWGFEGFARIALKAVHEVRTARNGQAEASS